VRWLLVVCECTSLRRLPLHGCRPITRLRAYANLVCCALASGEGRRHHAFRHSCMHVGTPFGLYSLRAARLQAAYHDHLHRHALRRTRG
jgi:hypothetical protein